MLLDAAADDIEAFLAMRAPIFPPEKNIGPVSGTRAGRGRRVHEAGVNRFEHADPEHAVPTGTSGPTCERFVLARGYARGTSFDPLSPRHGDVELLTSGSGEPPTRAVTPGADRTCARERPRDRRRAGSVAPGA